MKDIKKYIFIIWLVVFIGTVGYTLFIESSAFDTKTLYIFLSMITFPLGIVGMFLMNIITSIFSELNAVSFLVVGIIFFIIGYLQWVVIIGGFINFIQKKIKKY